MTNVIAKFANEVGVKNTIFLLLSFGGIGKPLTIVEYSEFIRTVFV